MKKKILNWLQLTDQVTVKVYNGYGDVDQLKIWGHVLSFSPLPRKKYSSSFLTNLLAILRLFMVKPWSQSKLLLKWNDEIHEVISEADGFFEFAWKPETPVEPGWHAVKISCASNEIVLATGEGKVFIPHVYQYAFISDIDDTFMISHSTNLRKKLFVLFTENAESRKPFEGVIHHYQLLSMASATAGIPNPFFYVSSSEWNLYDYISEFQRKNEMPKGILLLNQLKRFTDLWKTGTEKHSGKYTRIVRILEAFPLQKYVLLGDDGQRDPEIYSEVVKDFADQILAVYIRKIKADRQPIVSKLVAEMETQKVSCCYFEHSSEAIEHSRRIGLIQ